MSELDIILKLQQIGCKALDYVMFALTQLGDETFFLIIAVIIFWCIDKRFGYRFIVVFMAGQLFTGAFKVIFKRQRPYEKGALAVFAKSSGYSFPSGHSQSIANITTQTFLFTDKNYPSYRKAAIVVGICAVITVMFTRMYLGQHYLTDVIAGATLGIIAAVLFSKLFDLFGAKEEMLMFIFLPLSVILAAGLFKYDDEIAKVLGILGSVSLGYYLEKRYVNYDVKSKKIYHYIIKVLAGSVVLIVIREGIRLIGVKLEAHGGLLFALTYVRYFLVGIIASLIAPLVFKAIKI